MHWLLRMPRDGGQLRQHPVVQAWPQAQWDTLAAAHDTLNAMLALAEQVRADRQITDIVNIGIGGSHLGPEVVVQGLEDWVDAGKRFHFVSNVDGHELGHVLRQVRPESTLFLIASKSFTTAETMLNAHSAREWFLRQGGCAQPSAAVSIAQHFVALTTNVAAAQAFKAIGGFINDYFITPLENAWNTLKKIIDNLPSLDGVKDFLGGRYEQFFTPITPQLAGAGAGGSKTLEIGKIDIHTQATNADGIAADIGKGINKNSGLYWGTATGTRGND
jgi:hypothetical protein